MKSSNSRFWTECSHSFDEDALNIEECNEIFYNIQWKKNLKTFTGMPSQTAKPSVGFGINFNTSYTYRI